MRVRSVYICMCVCACVCACMRVCERKRERKRERLQESDRVRKLKKKEKGRDTNECVGERVRKTVCFERDKDRETVREREDGRERLCVCV
jgi:hypothetical protein